jgi:hypothetical protein
MALDSPAPMTYSGSAQRVMRLRRRLKQRWQRGWITPVAIVLILFWWLAVTLWYPLWLLTRWSVSVLTADARRKRGHRDKGSNGRRA